jgi:hypothetical protein
MSARALIADVAWSLAVCTLERRLKPIKRQFDVGVQAHDFGRSRLQL